MMCSKWQKQENSPPVALLALDISKIFLKIFEKSKSLKSQTVMNNVFFCITSVSPLEGVVPEHVNCSHNFQMKLVFICGLS